MASDDRDRSESPTARRLEEARRRGQVARSQELNAAVVLLAAVAFFAFAGAGFFEQLVGVMRRGFEAIPREDLTPQAVYTLLFQWGWLSAKIAGPFMLFILLVGVGVNVFQVGFMIREEALTPKWDRLNPVSGARNLISLRTLEETVKSPIKIFLIGYVAYLTLLDRTEEIIVLADSAPLDAFRTVGGISFQVALRATLAYLALAFLDYGFQRWEHLRSLRMTKQEVKEELKQADGDPLIRSRVRSLHRQMAFRRMMSEVPKASVVITNPTHLAVALRYDQEKMHAPKVVAKGARLTARRIVELARASGVPLVENVPVAQALYKLVAVGQEIPAALYKAVAEVLAYVYMLNRKVG